MKLSLKAAVLFFAAMLACVATPASAGDSRDGHNRTITVYNNSDYTVMHIYFGATYSNSYYSRDLLGDETLDSNYRIRINIDDGYGNCVYDLKAVTRSGENWTKRINVCEETSWSLGN